METTIMGYTGIIGYMLGLYRDNGKENGNYYRVYMGYTERMEKKMKTTILGYAGINGYILWLYRDNGKVNGNYKNGLYRDYSV